MGIRKRGDFSYQVYYYEKGKQVVDKTYDTEAEALMREAEIKRERSIGKKIERKLGIVKVKEALELYEELEASGKAGYAGNGIYRYKMWKNTKNKCCLQFLDENVSTITPNHINTWMRNRLKHVSASTLNRDLNELSAFFSWCRLHYEMYSFNNPVHDVKRPASNDERDRTIEEGGDEEKRLIDAISKSNTKILLGAFILAIETGIRRKELTGITLDNLMDLDTDAPYIVLKASNTKTKRKRSVPLSEAAARAVDMLLTIHEQMKEDDKRLEERRENKVKHDYNYLLMGILPNGLSQAFLKARKVSKVDDLRWHDLRHCATTRLLELGLDMSMVAKVTGHTNPKMLARYTNHTASLMSSRMRELKRKQDKN